MSIKISIDVGGTFTDLTLFNEKTGKINNYKSPTTSEDLTNGIINSINLAAKDHNLSLKSFLETTNTIIHGTTASTNALIEDNISKVGMITTEGFKDILWGREAGKEEPFNWKIEYPPPMVPRYRILTVNERINSEGGIETELNEEDVLKAIDQFKEWDIDALSVCLLWSISNPKHEQKIGEIIKKEWPEIDFDLSHQINPVIREYRRFIATVINSSLKKLIGEYLSNLENNLKENGFNGNLLLMTSSGGVLNTDEIKNKPILTVGSGPSMLPVAALYSGSLNKKNDNVIGIDMGGTSFDVGFVRQGEIAITRDAKIDPTEMGGDKLGISKVDVESIGAGGGSIAWLDAADYVHVGPQSAEAVPGPACYGLGGEEPTVTDANLLLGYLDPNYFLGGKMEIYPEKAKNALKQKISDPLNIDVIEAASRIYTTINYDMLTALRNLAIKRGIDPRESLLVCGGGAFGIHASEICRELGLREVLIPKQAGVFCSYGGLISDIKQDFRTTTLTTSNNFDYKTVNRILKSLKEKADSFFERVGIPNEKREIKYYMEAKYPQQVHSLDVPIELKHINASNLSDLIELFHETHLRYYANKDLNARIEFTGWRIRAIGRTEKPRLQEMEFQGETPSDTYKNSRNIYFQSKREFIETPTYYGEKLKYGNLIRGPAIIEERLTTVVVPPNTSVQVNMYGDYLMSLLY